jgi:hypothetical protein
LPKRRSLLRGLLVILAVGLLAGATVSVLLLSQSTLDSTSVSAPAAERELDEILSRFDAELCAEFVSADGRLVFRWRAVPGPVPPEPLHRLHGLLWDPASSRLVRASVPAWGVSLARSKLAVLGVFPGSLERRLGVDVELPDLERCGPGLILDQALSGGRRLLVWGD